MKIAWVFGPHRQDLSYMLTADDGHTNLWAYSSRYYDVQVFVPANFNGTFTRNDYTVHGHAEYADLLANFAARGPWDAVVCYGPFNEQEWVGVRERSGTAIVCLDYAGGPLCDLDGKKPAGAVFFDHVFTAHESQARWLRDLGVPASKARGVPTERYKPIPGVPKQFHVIYPANFNIGKRPQLVAQYCEQYAPTLPSLFLGNFETPEVVDMVRCGGIPLNKTGIPQRNNIRLGGRAPYAVMPLVYNASEFCVVGSQEEAGPWVALEAMACGVPTVIMADCAWGVSEAFAELEHEFQGGVRVVPASPDAIHGAIEDMRSEYADESRMARKAVVERYCWWSQYVTTDKTLKNLAALKQAGQTL